MKHAIKSAKNRSGFISTILLPVHHTERETRFGVLQASLAMALVFGTVALMRLGIVVLQNGVHAR